MPLKAEIDGLFVSHMTKTETTDITQLRRANIILAARQMLHS